MSTAESVGVEAGHTRMGSRWALLKQAMLNLMINATRAMADARRRHEPQQLAAAAPIIHWMTVAGSGTALAERDPPPPFVSPKWSRQSL